MREGMEIRAMELKWCLEASVLSVVQVHTYQVEAQLASELKHSW